MPDYPREKSLVVAIEYHDAETPWVDDRKVAAFASVYLARGVYADEVFGHAYMRRGGASYICIAERLARENAEALSQSLVDLLRGQGLHVGAGTFTDE